MEMGRKNPNCAADFMRMIAAMSATLKEQPPRTQQVAEPEPRHTLDERSTPSDFGEQQQEVANDMDVDEEDEEAAYIDDDEENDTTVQLEIVQSQSVFTPSMGAHIIADTQEIATSAFIDDASEKEMQEIRDIHNI